MDRVVLSARETIRRILQQTGLPLYGFCPFEAVRDRLLPCGAAARLPKNSRTILVFLFPYRFEETGQRNLSRYACVPDYHRTAGQVLRAAAESLKREFPSSAFEDFIDNSPIPEVYAAALAGLGRVGDNGLLLHPVFGSWVFIGCLVTDLDLRVTACVPQECLHCGTCHRLCPAGCLETADKPHRCLSALTQKKGELTDQEAALLAGSPLVWGCDVCQDCCPMNRKTKLEPHPCFTSYDGWLDREKLDGLNKQGLKEKAYGWRGRAVLERNLSVWHAKTGED